MNTQENTRIVPVSTAVLLRQMLASSGQHNLVERKLAQHVEMVSRLACTNRLDLPRLGVAPLFEGVRLVTRTRPNWALYNLSQDPLYQAGKFPIPARHLQHLQRLNHAGVQFDALYVAHELPAGFRPGRDRLDLGLFVPEPPRVATRLAEVLGRSADGLLALTARPLAILASAGVSAAAVLLDPVLMGVILPPDVNPEPEATAVWFLLAAWSW